MTFAAMSSYLSQPGDPTTCQDRQGPSPQAAAGAISLLTLIGLFRVLGRPEPPPPGAWQPPWAPLCTTSMSPSVADLLERMVGRYVKFVAKPEHGDALARLLLDVADSVRGARGCLIYVINRAVDESETVWVTELWESQQAVDASLHALQTEGGKARLAEIMDVVARPPERVDLRPLGGVGLDG
jgi:quinol monooxygenase YgiN